MKTSHKHRARVIPARETPAGSPLGLSAKWYRQLVEESLGLICAHDLEGRFLFVNAAAARSLGYEARAWVGQNLRDFIAPDARGLFDEYLARIRDSSTDSGLLRVLDSGGGERVWMYHNVRAEESGEPPYVLGHAIDITDRVRAEQALRKSREALHEAYRELDARVQARTDELQAANVRLLAEMGERQRAQQRERETLTFLAAASDELIATPDVDTLLATLARLPVPFLAQWAIVHVVGARGRRSSDAHDPNSQRDPSAAAQDVTLRAVAGRHVDPSKADAIASLLDVSPSPDSLVARVIHEPIAETLTVGPDELEALLGAGPHQVVMRSLGVGAAVVVPLVVDHRTIGALSLVARTGGVFADSDLAVVDELLRRFRVALTQARLYREAQEANRLKDEFLATLSHELRTPLNAILGWARILRNRPLDDSAVHAVRVIERNAEAQARLIEDVLDVSRIITGKLTLETEPVRLPAVVAAALDSVRPAATAKGVRLAEAMEPTRTVIGDSHRLQQVIWNLLSNAVKFTPAGGTVVVGLRQVGEAVELSVSDTGVGIRADALSFVFDRFRQADASTTRSQAGLGLGLAIVRHLVELHGGTVAVSSVERQGATFTVSLPTRAMATDLGPAALDLVEAHASAAPDLPLRGCRALVVDDHQDARELAEAVLQGAGAVVATADSATGALCLLESSPVDVLVADIGLPGEDGYTLMRRIRSLAPDRGGCVVALALTGYARAEDRAQALAAGFNGYLVKPAEPLSLVLTIRALLSAQPRTA